MMKPSIAVIFGFLILSITGCGGSGGGGGDHSVINTAGTGNSALQMGLLQFRTQHNLVDNSCLSSNDCNLTMEDEATTAAWLDELASISNMAVLHWDRPIPWLAFDADPPPGTSRVDFYDGRIDAELRTWIDAFVPHFQRMSSGYVAVSVLNGHRTRLQQCRVDASLDADVTGHCPVLEPGSQISFQYDPGSGPVNASFDLARSYSNFILYLYDKLQPEYLALMVEINLYKELEAACAANWGGVARLYRHIYDAVRPQVDHQTQVFATLAFQWLLDYNDVTCHGAMAVETCTGAPSPPAYGVPDPDTCYPLDLSAITDLDQGGRLEILALSFYPDALLMDVADDNLLKFYPEDWDGVSDCQLRAQTFPFLDPVSALDRFIWSKPIAIADLGARSDRTLHFRGGYLIQPPGDLVSQNFWLDHFLTVAKERNFEFYVQAFSDDFPAIGTWTVHQGVMDMDLYSLFNNFAYMGIYDPDGIEKASVTQTWLDALH